MSENHLSQQDTSAPRTSYSLRDNLERFFDIVTLKTFPKLSYIIVTCSILEHLSEAGLMGLMAIHFQTLFQLQPSGVTMALHLYYFLKYCAVLVGAVLADSYFGRVKLIICGLTIFSVGNILLTLSSTIRKAFPSRLVLLLSLVAKVIGPGCILPCLIPLAADQIHQQKTTYLEMKAFFAFYFAMNQIGDFIAKLFLPLVLEVSCFKLDSCYPLAFSIPAILSCLSLVIFWVIRKQCFSVRPHQPIVIQGLQCCWHAFRMKIKKRKEETRSHWIYFADDRYDMKFIEDIKCTIDVLLVPIPIYWSLYDQQFTSWTLQATRLNTEISPSFRIMPEQTQAFGPFFFLLFIPVLHFFLYDLLYPFRFLRTLLRRMVTGGFLIAMAFMMASSLELRIEFSYPDFPASDLGYIYAYNGLNSEITVKIENQKVIIAPHTVSQMVAHLTEDTFQYTAVITYDDKKITAEVNAKRKKATSYAAMGPEPVEFVHVGTVDQVFKHTKGRVGLRVICVDKFYCQNVTLRLYPQTWYIQRPIIVSIVSPEEPIKLTMLSGIYEVYADYKNNHSNTVINLGTGGTYTLMVYSDNNNLAVKLFEITPPNKISILWMIPQYAILSVSAVLFQISAFAFIYTETPDQMKSLAWSMCHMTLSTGNVITAILGGTGKPSTNFLIFSLGMFLCMFLFMQSAASYKYTHKYKEKRSEKKSILQLF